MAVHAPEYCKAQERHSLYSDVAKFQHSKWKRGQKCTYSITLFVFFKKKKIYVIISTYLHQLSLEEYEKIDDFGYFWDWEWEGDFI